MPIRFVKSFSRFDSRTSSLLATTAAGYAARLGSAVVVLITVPLARHTLDGELFGTWMMLSSLTAFFAFTDLGIGNAIMNRITAAEANGDREGARSVVSAGYVCTGIIACILMLTWFIWVAVSPTPTSLTGTVSPANQREVLMAMHVFAVLFSLSIPSGTIQMVQLGAQQGAWAGFTQLAASAFALVLVSSALLLRLPLAFVLLGSLGAQVLINMASTLIWLHRKGWLTTMARSRLKPGIVKDLFRSGGAFLVLQLAVAFAFQSDAIVITQKLGQAAYGDFAVVQKLYQIVSVLLTAFTAGLWPAFGDAIARGDKAWALAALRRAFIGVGVLVGGVCAALLFTAGMLTKWWVGMEVPPSFALLAALSAWTLVGALGSIGGAFMNGANLLRIQAVTAIAMAAAAFAGKWVLTPVMGSAGAVLATLLAYCAISVPAQIFVFRRFVTQAR